MCGTDYQQIIVRLYKMKIKVANMIMKVCEKACLRLFRGELLQLLFIRAGARLLLNSRMHIASRTSETLVTHVIVVIMSAELTLNVENTVTRDVAGIKAAVAESFRFDGFHSIEPRFWT